MGKGKPERVAAILFLRRALRDSGRLADALDPRRRRGYEDPILRALDAIASSASRALDQEGVAP